MGNLQGKWIFISGSRRGIGRACVSAFARRGASIIAHARKRDDDFENDMRKEAICNNVDIRTIYFDMAAEEAMKSEIKNLLMEIKPDCLVNNAVMQHGGFFILTRIEDIEKVFETNLFAQMRLTQLLLKPMLARKAGSIINIASVSGIDMRPGHSAYGVSKAALIAWTKVLAAETGTYNVRVNAIAPGLTDTDGGALTEEKAKNALLAASAMHRMGQPQEIAEVACFLASDASSFINGEVIRVDGGNM